jgi:hypothetical protein
MKTMTTTKTTTKRKKFATSINFDDVDSDADFNNVDSKTFKSMKAIETRLRFISEKKLTRFCSENRFETRNVHFLLHC